MENEFGIEVSLPDGTEARWLVAEVDERTVDRLMEAIEKIMGPPDTIKI